MSKFEIRVRLWFVRQIARHMRIEDLRQVLAEVKRMPPGEPVRFTRRPHPHAGHAGADATDKGK